MERYILSVAVEVALDGACHACMDRQTGEELNCRVYDAKFFLSRTDLYKANIKNVHSRREVINVGKSVFVVRQVI